MEIIIVRQKRKQF